MFKTRQAPPVKQILRHPFALAFSPSYLYNYESVCKNAFIKKRFYLRF